jgi:predicted secreted Zn-dependent protease
MAVCQHVAARGFATRKEMGIAIALAVALGLQAASIVAGDASTVDSIPVTLNEKLVRYEVKGDTSHELFDHMKKVGPLDEKSAKRYQGLTVWAARWTFDTARQADGRCGLEHVKVELEVLMTLPEWHPKRHADPRLEQAWPGYLASLTGHEMGHRANGVKAAFAVRDALAAMASMEDCQALAMAADSSANAAFGSYMGADVEYDRETNHGATQIMQLP